MLLFASSVFQLVSCPVGTVSLEDLRLDKKEMIIQAQRQELDQMRKEDAR